MLNPLDSVPAVRRIETNRDDVYAFEIAGHISSADVENFYGLLEGAYALHDRIDLLVQMVENDGVDWNEISPDTASEGRDIASRHIRRCAIIGKSSGIRCLGRFFDPPSPVETRHFDMDEEAEAWSWIDTRRIDAR